MTTTPSNGKEQQPMAGQLMGDLIILPGGGMQVTPYAGLTAAKAAALVQKQVG